MRTAIRKSIAPIPQQIGGIQSLQCLILFSPCVCSPYGGHSVLPVSQSTHSCDVTKQRPVSLTYIVPGTIKFIPAYLSFSRYFCHISSVPQWQNVIRTPTSLYLPSIIKTAFISSLTTSCGRASAKKVIGISLVKLLSV